MVLLNSCLSRLYSRSFIRFVTPSLLSTTLVACSQCPIFRGNLSHTCLTAVNWSWNSWGSDDALGTSQKVEYRHHLIFTVCSSSLPFQYINWLKRIFSWHILSLVCFTLWYFSWFKILSLIVRSHSDSKTAYIEHTFCLSLTTSSYAVELVSQAAQALQVRSETLHQYIPVHLTHSFMWCICTVQVLQQSLSNDLGRLMRCKGPLPGEAPVHPHHSIPILEL